MCGSRLIAERSPPKKREGRKRSCVNQNKGVDVSAIPKLGHYDATHGLCKSTQ